ncbi:hypothetical protein [Mesorhizobium sp.]|uniref:hypothetical protein n=1 Tax=Mesorhizobium sp. TaxID=1871066 RepID=UPI000FE2C296|nr:hypothetical protein [Mesorhizobium sp.]RWN94515.1 MAG: hypothetical protein EOS06_30795 [Mesorhizobium sp.]
MNDRNIVQASMKNLIGTCTMTIASIPNPDLVSTAVIYMAVLENQSGDDENIYPPLMQMMAEIAAAN